MTEQVRRSSGVITYPLVHDSEVDVHVDAAHSTVLLMPDQMYSAFLYRFYPPRVLTHRQHLGVDCCRSTSVTSYRISSNMNPQGGPDVPGIRSLRPV